MIAQAKGLTPEFCRLNQSIHFQDVFVRHAIALILFHENFSQHFELVERNIWKLGPFHVRLESGPELPFAGVSRNADKTDQAFVGVLTPFVFLHGLWSREFCDAEVVGL